jgi:phospholipase C
MSTCTKWVTQVVITCKNWASKADYTCTTWADEGSSQCSQWADHGSNQCSQWADEGSNQCVSWQKCHWYTPWNCIAGFFCRAYYWVAQWVCKAWYWVANWVCQAWYWVAKWVCKAFAWIVKAFCVIFSWFFTLVCVAWDWLRCAVLAIIKAISALFGTRRDGPAKIERVFVVMLENRSYDHIFGFSNLTGVDIDGNPTTAEGADPTRDTNTDPSNGTVTAVSTGADFFLKNKDKDPGHEFENTVTALCGNGVVFPATHVYPTIDNSGFVANYRNSGSATPERIMRCFAPEQLPVLNTLAREFAVCDHWFSSLPGPTWPNRFFALAASSGGLDHSPTPLDIVSATTVDGYRMANGNVFDLLDEYCINWRIFEGDDFPVSFALAGMNLNALEGRFTDFDDFTSTISDPSFDAKFVFIEPKYGKHAFDVTGPGDFTCGNSMHPLDDITRGEKLVKEIYEAVRNSPHWNTSVLIVMFDEHGGFYDHVAPPDAVAPGDVITASYNTHGFKFDQLGVRVPALVISPWVKQGVIDQTKYDHTSMLATVERLFGMHHLTERDRLAQDFIHLFSLAEPRTNAPTSMPEPAINRESLGCDDENETMDGLLAQRSELRLARTAGIYRERRLDEYPLTPAQVGFTQVALLRVLNTVLQPERDRWIEQYRSMRSGVDGAIFMTDAKLRIRYGIDFHRPNVAQR